ncbi:ABC transporter ATP-binding protein [Ruicaihuangia caeni]|uniref:ABC transporter ATP-binding protein n=1 Tax=Ruicaihuangia caeni TaxID=3042517 RepID=A0AAW6T5J2_9MICO|nr:ABC transporter ATP-binding protein [Klugiella sp. YN-L-19]MDI2099095.1 ABC transporter ATP-binding protein [Klugiella sp. YN-L-19]
MLEVDSLYVAYGPVTALRGVSIKVEKGSFVGVVGPNGAGKSTLLNTIAGVVKPKSGSVTLAGSKLSGARAEHIVGKHLSLVPEGRRIFGQMTVLENLQLGTTVRKDREQARTHITEMMEVFPILGRFRDRRAGHLSGGEQQQLAIARALLARPEYLLLDEPSAGLAPVIVDSVFEVLKRLHNEGVSILLVEQVAHRTVETADHSYVLQHGNIVARGTASELLQGGLLEAAYLGADGAAPEPEGAGQA